MGLGRDLGDIGGGRRKRPHALREVVRSQHGEDPGDSRGLPYPGDRGVGMRATHKSGVREERELDVVDEAA